MSRYDFLAEAENDLAETIAYLDQAASEDVSYRFVRCVTVQARLLSEFSGIGTPCRFVRFDVATVRGIRVKGFPRWLIFYKPISSGI